MDDFKAKILAEIKAHEEALRAQDGDITIEDVVQASGVSVQTAKRLLEDLEGKGRVMKVKIRLDTGYIVTAWRPIADS